MSQMLSLAQKVRQLKVGKSFVVKTKRDQQEVCRMAKVLRDTGFIDFDIVTKESPDGFKVAAI